METLWSFIGWSFATNRRSITFTYNHWVHSLENFYPGQIEPFKSYGRWEHEVSLLSRCSNHFPAKARNLLLQPCPKVFIMFLFECTVNLLKGNMQGNKRPDKTSNGSTIAFSKELHMEAKKRRSDVRKGLQLKTVITLYLMNDLSRFGAVCFRPCFCVQQQEFEHSGSYKIGVSRVSSWTKSHIPN